MVFLEESEASEKWNTGEHVSINIRQANRSDVNIVADLVYALLSELTPPDAKPPLLEVVRAAAESVLNENTAVWAFLATDDLGNAIGVLTLNECASIYAGGKFGEISELYVTPIARSIGVGPELLRRAVTFGRKKEWGRLEVGAPDVPRWSRTVSFYLNNGFIEVGPRLKLLL